MKLKDVIIKCVTRRHVALIYVILKYVSLKDVTLKYMTLKDVTLKYVTLNVILKTLQDMTLRKVNSESGMKSRKGGD